MALDLGQLLLRLKVDEKGFNAGLSAAEKRSKSFRVAATAAFLAVGVAAVKFGADSLRAYGEAEAAQQKLTFAFQRFPKLADTNISALRRLNSEQQKKTRFDDDATAAAQAQLAQFKLTGQQILQLTPLMQDYAARTGKDLPAAANDLGRAVLGQGRALKSVGLNLKDTGSQTGNLEQLMKGLRTQVGGFAEIEGKSAAGRVEILKNQFGELQEQAGANLAPALSKVVGILTSLVMIVGENADVVGPLAVGVVGLTAVIWLSNKAVRAYTVAHGLMGAAMASNSKIIAGVASKLGPLGIAIGAGATLLGVFATQQKKAELETRAFTDSLTFQNGVLDDNSAQMLAKRLADEGALEAARAAGVAEGDYVRALIEGGGARDRMLKLLDDTALGHRASADAVQGDVGAHLDIVDSADKAADKLQLMGGELDASKRAAELAKAAYSGVSVSSEDLTTAQGKLAAAQEKLAGATAKARLEMTLLKGEAISAEEANIAWEESIDAAKQSIKDNGKEMRTHTDGGQANRSALVGMVKALDEKTVADIRNNVSTKKVTERFNENRGQLIKVATQMTGNKKVATQMIDEFLSTPKELRTKAKADTKAARAEVRELRAEIKKIKDQLAEIKYSTNAGELASKWQVRADGSVKGHPNLAGGGPVRGIGGSRQDNVAGIDWATGRQTSWVSPGEFVVNAKSYAQNRSLVEAINAGRGGLPGFAGGGRLNNGPLNNGSRLNTGTPHGSGIDIGASVPSGHGPTFRKVGDELGERLALRIGNQVGGGIYKQLKKISDQASAAASSGGPVGSGGYAKALSYAKAHEGHPYIFGSMWDCSGFISALHNIILGRGPGGRRYSTPAFHGAHAAGFTRGKRSPFMVGVNPAPGKFGHMAGTLNGVNVESAGGVGVRVGGGARGHGFGSWHGGLAGGGVVGDPPFDLLDPAGQRYDPKLRALWDQMRHAGALATGTRSARPGFSWTAEKGAEVVVNPQLRKYDGGERVFDHKDTKRLLGGGGDWKGSPAIGEVNFTMPASLDPVAAANLAGGLLVAKLSAKGIGR